MVTKVNCCMLSFWYAPMVLKIKLIMLSLCVRIWSSEAIIMIQWSSTSPRYVCAAGEMLTED